MPKRCSHRGGTQEMGVCHPGQERVKRKKKDRVFVRSKLGGRKKKKKGGKKKCKTAIDLGVCEIKVNQTDNYKSMFFCFFYPFCFPKALPPSCLVQLKDVVL